MTTFFPFSIIGLDTHPSSNTTTSRSSETKSSASTSWLGCTVSRNLVPLRPDGHLLEFPQIRVDCFTRPHPPTSDKAWHLPPGPVLAPPAQLYLLTHVHTDHLLGLSDNFTGQIVCSPDTKRLLLQLESEKERGYVVDGTKEIGAKKYGGLKARVEGKGTKDERSVDRIASAPVTRADGRKRSRTACPGRSN